MIFRRIALATAISVAIAALSTLEAGGAVARAIRRVVPFA